MFHTKTENGVVLCCVRPKSVFPPHQPVLDCGMYRTWFSIKMAMTMVVMLVGLFISGFLMLMQPSNAVLTLHDVQVIERLNDYQFRMASQDSDSKEWNAFFIHFCPTFQLPQEMRSGTTLKVLKYARDYTHDCADISGRNLGYILRRDDHGNPIITLRRQTAESSRSPYANQTVASN